MRALGFAGEMQVTTTPGVSVCVGVMESRARLELGLRDMCMGAMVCSSVGVVGKGACVKGQTRVVHVIIGLDGALGPGYECV